MLKDKFMSMPLDDQLIYINSKLKIGESIRTISTEMEVNKSTISSLFKRNGYKYDTISKQFINNEVVVDKLDSKPTIDSKPVSKPILHIPTNIKTKEETQAFNVVLNKKLVIALDKKAIEKNYPSRTQLVAFLLQWCIDNMD